VSFTGASEERSDWLQLLKENYLILLSLEHKNQAVAHCIGGFISTLN
jgi:hypothetical protein